LAAVVVNIATVAGCFLERKDQHLIHVGISGGNQVRTSSKGDSLGVAEGMSG
jgi:hypothetical protein